MLDEIEKRQVIDLVRQVIAEHEADVIVAQAEHDEAAAREMMSDEDIHAAMKINPMWLHKGKVFLS